MSDMSVLEKLNFGFTYKPVDYQVVEVEIHPDFMVADWGEAYAADLERRNPLKFKSSSYLFNGEKKQLTAQVITNYMAQLIIYRVDDVNNKLKGLYHLVKQLGIPTWIQYVISSIGNADDWDRGLHFVPVLPQSVVMMDINEMLAISHVLRSFTSDGKPFFTNAWPKTKDGDKDVMSYAVVDGFVSGNDKSALPIKTYVAGFLGAKLRQEITFKMLYRMNYDEVAQLRAMLITNDTILE